MSLILHRKKLKQALDLTKPIELRTKNTISIVNVLDQTEHKLDRSMYEKRGGLHTELSLFSHIHDNVINSIKDRLTKLNFKYYY